MVYKAFLILLFLVSPFFVACNHPYLKVRSEGLYPSYLSSEKINTPDPDRNAFYGEQIVIHWKIPPECFRPDAYFICLTLRFGDHTFETIYHTPSDWKGYWVYQLLNASYWEKEGILSYKVELYEEELLFADWKHHIWADWIEVSPAI